jgi:hypothetical protein
MLQLQDPPVVPGHDIVIDLSPIMRANANALLLLLLGIYLPELAGYLSD